MWSLHKGLGGSWGGYLAVPEIAAFMLRISGGRWTVFNRLYCPLRTILPLPATEVGK